MARSCTPVRLDRVSGRSPAVGLGLDLYSEELAVCRLGADDVVPGWARDPASGPITSITRTPDELSIVVSAGAVPDGIRAERGWRALAVRGPLDFSLTGVLAGLATPLAEADVPIFVVSTHDTDWLLVKATKIDDAVAALRSAGHTIETNG